MSDAAGRFTPSPGAFTIVLPIRFSHCDPAGIVYFPNYFDLVHAALEDWYESVLGFGFRALIGSGHGAPIVHAECDFRIPSRMGDALSLTLLVERLGGASVSYRVIGHVDGLERFSARIVTAFLSLATGKAVPIPAELRAKMDAYRISTLSPKRERE
jgi:4-hydroxybenzoyl-CoA thioesterase